MKHTDYVRELEKDPEYLAASEALKLHFALSKAVVGGRIQKGWSQSELARRAGTKQANISRIESATANPTLDLVHRILRALDIEFQFITSATTESYKSIIFNNELIEVQNWPVAIADESTITTAELC